MFNYCRLFCNHLHPKVIHSFAKIVEAGKECNFTLSLKTP